jgi:glycosyltransferase involved in cell wall biosynthesis
LPKSRDKATVSVCLIAYNHAKFISQALQSIWVQSCRARIEVVLGDDASSDGTPEVAQAEAQRWGDRLTILRRESNLGVGGNVLDTLAVCTGDYIALLEGDDFWTNPHKLERQIEMLERRPDASGCFHPVQVVDGAGRRIGSKQIPRRYRELDGRRLLQVGNVIPTCSVLLRNLGAPPEWLRGLTVVDSPLLVWAGMHGPLVCLPSEMAAYRLHSGSVFSAADNERRLGYVTNMYAAVAENYPQWRAIATARADYWRAVHAAQSGDMKTARHNAISRALAPPATLESLKAMLIALSPRLYARLQSRLSR